MSKRTIFLIFTAVVLAVAYVKFFKPDWFTPKKIQIMYRNFPARSRRTGTTRMALTFYLDKPYKLTSIKVVSAAEAQTNKYPHSLWHLVAQTNSVPTIEFDYGGHIVGMKPEIAHASPEPLEVGQRYTMHIETADKVQGEVTFNSK